MTTNTTVTAFNTALVQQIMQECREALQPIADKYGLKLDHHGRTYQSTRMPVMLQMLVKTTDEKGNELDALALDFKKLAWSFGMKEEDLGRTFAHNGETYTLVGCNKKGKRYPLVARRSDGKTFKFAVESVKRGLTSAADAA